MYPLSLFQIWIAWAEYSLNGGMCKRAGSARPYRYADGERVIQCPPIPREEADMATRTMTAAPAAPDRAKRYPTDEELEALSKIYPPSDEMFPPSEQGMGESFPHSLRSAEFIELLRRALEDEEDVVFGADVNLYYDEEDPHLVLAPDVMIVFHQQAGRVELGKSYLIWIWDKPPDFIMEFGSETTARRDLGVKRNTYARIGVPEYWMCDPHESPYYGFRLRGEQLVNGAYEPIPMYETEDGWLCAYSEVLGYEICWTGSRLRLRDSETGILVPTQAETAARLDETAARLNVERQRTESERRRADDAERQRDDAEARAKAAEEALARLRERSGI